MIAALVPANTDTAALGSDLTAVVLGSPSDRLRLLLDSVADRESSGSVVSWRFTPKSVRRALDDGADVAVLQAHLESVAGKELPQALRYLLKDVARRHGELRLSAQGTLIRGLEEPRVAEVLADSSLRGPWPASAGTDHPHQSLLGGRDPRRATTGRLLPDPGGQPR